MVTGIAFQTDRMNQEIWWGPVLVLCGPFRVPAPLKHFSLWSETLTFFFLRSASYSTFTCFFLRMWPEVNSPGSDGGILQPAHSYSAPQRSTFFPDETHKSNFDPEVSRIPEPFFLFRGKWLWFFCGRQVFYTHTRHPTLNTSVFLKAWKRRWMLWGQFRAYRHMFLCSPVQQKRWLL